MNISPDPASTDQIKREYRRGVINLDRVVERLLRLGHTPAAAQEIATALTDGPEVRNV